MTNVVDLLERLGQDAQVRRLDADRLLAALIQEGVEPAVRDAIADADNRRLERLLGCSSAVCCMIHAPDEEEEGDDDAPPDQDDGEETEEAPPRESAVRRAAAPR